MCSPFRVLEDRGQEPGKDLFRRRKKVHFLLYAMEKLFDCPGHDHGRVRPASFADPEGVFGDFIPWHRFGTDIVERAICESSFEGKKITNDKDAVHVRCLCVVVGGL